MPQTGQQLPVPPAALLPQEPPPVPGPGGAAAPPHQYAQNLYGQAYSDLPLLAGGPTKAAAATGPPKAPYPRPTSEHVPLERLGYRVNDFCKVVGIGRTYLYRLIASGRIRSVLIGGRRIIPADEARRLIREGAPMP
jgi:excisionase family DNA binding protein